MKQFRTGTYTCIFEDTFIQMDEVRDEVLLAETRMNEGKVRFHLHDGFKPEWYNTIEDTPEFGKEYLGYNKLWIDEDYNPDGICLCVPNDDGSWDILTWCGLHDVWHTINTLENKETKEFRNVEEPTHWKYKPMPPTNDVQLNKL